MAYEKQFDVDPDDYSIFGYKLSAELNKYLMSIRTEGYTEGQAQDKVDVVFVALSGLLVTIDDLESKAQSMQKLITGIYEDEDL
jgi:hypothetical protein